MSQRRKITAAEVIEALKAANGEELAEIRRLLGVPTLWPQPMPYPVVPSVPAPDPTPRPALPPWYIGDQWPYGFGSICGSAPRDDVTVRI